MEKEIHIRLLHYGFVVIDKSWNVQNVYDNYWRMYINNCDGPEVRLPDGRFTIPKNRVTFLPAWVRFSCHNVRPVKHFYVHFDVVGLGDQIVRKIFNRPATLSAPADYKRTAAFLAQNRDGVSGLCRVKSLVYRYFSELFDQLPPRLAEEVTRSLSARNRFAPVLQYIEHHLAEPLTNERLAKISHMSESYFAHCFRDLMDRTPARFVLQSRIAAAAKLILFTSDPIDTVAERTGFANRFHFSRNFKKLMGVTPAAYRKTTRV